MPFVLNHDLEVKAPAALVWEVITDFAHYRDWNPFVVECRSTLEPGEPIDMQVMLTDKPQDVHEVVVECVPGRRFAYRMKPIPLGALSSLRSHDIASRGAGSSTYRSHFELNGWLAPVVLALYRKNLERAFGSMSAAIQQRAEALWLDRQKKSA
jgi:hypothetical protein